MLLFPASVRPILASRTLGLSDLPIFAMRGLRDSSKMLYLSYGGLTSGLTRCFVAFVSEKSEVGWNDDGFA
jgi:hypothetical protein